LAEIFLISHCRMLSLLASDRRCPPEIVTIGDISLPMGGK
jgi:hypothetical protein